MVAVTVTANVLVTDLVGSTLVLSRQGESAADEVRRRHDALVSNVVGVFHGEVVKSTGDGALALLPSADLLVRAGAAITQAARRDGIALRVGLASGDVTRTDADCFGEAVVIATRLCDSAAAGQVLIAPSTVAIRGRRSEPPLRVLPSRALKGFDDPLDVHEVDGHTAGEPTAATSTTEPFIGRADVVAVVHRSWSDQPTRPIVLRGEPGIGKTSVARALTATTDTDTIWVSFEPTVSDGFAHLCAAIDQFVREREVGPLAALGRERLGLAATHLPSLAERLPVDPVAPDDDDRASFFDAVLDVVRSRPRPTTLVLDDIQWAGGTTLALLQRTAQARQSPPIRVLATCRPPLTAEMAGVEAVVVDVGPLDDDDLEHLVQSRGFDRHVAAHAARRAAGNPFLALSAAGARSGPDATDGVAARFLALPAPVTSMIGIAALIGRRIDVPLLRRVSGSAGDDVLHALEVATDAGLLRVDGGDVVFAHDLVREAAERSVPSVRRPSIHAAIAEVLEARGDEMGAVPHLLDGFSALEPNRVVAQIRAIGEQLFQRGAYEDELAIASRLLDEVERDDRSTLADLAWAHLVVAMALAGLGHIADEKRHAALAGAAALEADDTEALTFAAIARASYALAGVADSATLDLLDAALERVGPDLSAAASLSGFRAFYLFHQERGGEEARAAGARAIEMARASGDPEALANALLTTSFIGLAGHAIDAQDRIVGELREAAASLPFRPSLGFRMASHRQGLVLCLQRADRPGFELHRAAVAELAARMVATLGQRLVEVWTGLAALLDGDPDGAIEHAIQFLRPDERDHNLFLSGAGQLNSAHRWKGSLEVVRDAMADFAERENGLPLTRSLGAVALAISGDIDRARSLLDPVLRSPTPLADDSTLSAQCAALIEACALTARPCPPVVEQALVPYAGQLVVTSWGVDVPGAADRFLAVLAAQRGDVAGASARFDAASELERRLSPVLPLRAQAWRHALLDDVPAPVVPAGLGGLTSEITALGAVGAAR